MEVIPDMFVLSKTENPVTLSNSGYHGPDGLQYETINESLVLSGGIRSGSSYEEVLYRRMVTVRIDANGKLLVDLSMSQQALSRWKVDVGQTIKTPSRSTSDDRTVELFVCDP